MVQPSTFNTPFMNTRLNHIQNRPELAPEAKWSAPALAKNCGVLGAHIGETSPKHMSTSPKAWLAEQRQHQAVKSLHNGSTVRGKPLFISLVDDDISMYHVAQAIAKSHSKNWILDYYPDCRQALQRLPFAPSNVVLVDIQMPNRSGMDCIRKLKCLLPGLPVVVFTACTDQENIFLSLMAGARGYLIKPVSSDQLIGAIEKVAQGSSALCEEAQTAMLTLLHGAFELALSNSKMVERERQIMACLAQNLADKEISERLHIAPNTVHVHLVRLFQKLGAHNRSEAIQKFFNVCAENSCCHLRQARW
jgi:DNA-binding NarL/FixJ family response regulator